MEDKQLPEKTHLDKLREGFLESYVHWRYVAETYGIRLYQVETAWLKYCKARDLYLDHRDRNIYYY